MGELRLIAYPISGRYDCPQSLNALAVTFQSLQCSMRACGGNINNKNLEKVCKSCDNYIVNARKKDWGQIDKPL